MASVKNIWILRNTVKNVKINRNTLLSSNKVSAANFSVSSASCDKITHTGQARAFTCPLQWEDNDYRNVRFIETPKQVNPSFAITLIDRVPPAAANKRVVWCDGGGGPTGHPKVYINLDKPGNHICGYCGLRFYNDGSHAH
ncbi:hypothetical protein B566_EDAN002915 [Ephemera danica]|nr:hypothetical protein B566_EDAN002915 [Ephemera danica]